MENASEGITIVIGALGTVTKGLIKGLEDLEIRGRVETIQTTALLRSARILKRVLTTSENFLSLRLQRQPLLYFDLRPEKNAIPRWCTGRWHILMAVMRGNRVGGNWLMKWDELKRFPWYTHRLMHQKRVTSELYDSYFRLMTIKHSISKIEWASNDYIIQLSSTSQWQLGWRSDGVIDEMW